MNQLFCRDNLAVMSALPEESVDFCLFDPPYNTGSKSLPYLDRRPDWAADMAPRLAAARRLLKSSGCLACYIDDHELENLLRILRVVFGKKNFLANISWSTSRGGSFGNISHVTEPILVYAKDRKSLRFPVVHSPTKNEHEFTNPDGPRWPLAQPDQGRTQPGTPLPHPTYSWHCKPADMVAKFPGAAFLYEYRNGRLELVSPLPPTSVLPKYYFDKEVLRRKQYLYLSARNSRKASLHTLAKRCKCRNQRPTTFTTPNNQVESQSGCAYRLPRTTCFAGEHIADSLHIGIDCSGYDHPAIGRLGVGVNDQIKPWFIRGPTKHVGSKEAGPRVAAIISIIETCRRLSLPLRAYLGSVLPGLANFRINRVAELTPNAWAARI